jgi:integrase/recombinase XerD
LTKVRAMKRAELQKTLQEFYEDFQLENRLKNLSEMTIRYPENKFEI